LLRSSQRRPSRRLLGLTGVLAAVALSIVATPGPAQAELVPCDPLYNCPGPPVHAPDRVAIGQDRDMDDAAEEAEDQAANSCPGHAYEVVRIRVVQLANDDWKYTLTYRCDSPIYD
jgi:hypothetical protein